MHLMSILESRTGRALAVSSVLSLGLIAGHGYADGVRKYRQPATAKVSTKIVGSIGSRFRTRAGKIVFKSVQPDSPAAVAGLNAGDVLLSLNGKPVTAASGAFAWIMQHPGHDLTLDVVQPTGRKSVTLAIRSEEMASGFEVEEGIEDLLSDGNRVSVVILVGTIVHQDDPRSTGQPAWIKARSLELRSNEEMLLLDMFRGDEQFSIVERARLGDILNEQALQQTGVVPESTRLTLGRMTGATHIINLEASIGSVRQARQGRFVHRLIEVESGRTVMTSVRLMTWRK